MHRLVWSIVVLSLCSEASMFVVSDKQGNVIKTSEMTQRNNQFLKQSATEYSYQAIYDELHKDEHFALIAQAANERLARIKKEQEAAKARGETYQLSSDDQAKLLADAHMLKGGRYVWGGTSPEGFDCSGYVQYLFKKQHINLPRTAWSQSKVGEEVHLSQLKRGDLLFFNTDKKRGIPVSHVGIYNGNGNFIHAASRKEGIIVSPFAGRYKECFVTARRIAPSSKIASAH